MDEQLLTALRRRYESAISSGDSGTAGSVLDQALAAPDFSPGIFFSEVVAPAHAAIAERCGTGELGVAERCRADNVTLEQLVRLRFTLKPRERLRRRAVVADRSPQYLGLLARMTADLLYWDGWDVEFLGAGIRAEEITAFVAKNPADLIVLADGQTSSSSSSEDKDYFSALAHIDPRPKLLVVTSIAKNFEGADIDAHIHDLTQVNDYARKLIGLSRGSAVLEEVLRSVGERLRGARKQRSMSQQDVSDRCSLDRAYLSELENGKQNATIGALIKVTSALDISLRDLFS